MSKRRSAEARSLTLPQYRAKRTKDRTKYSRKAKHKGRNLARSQAGDGRPVTRGLMTPNDHQHTSNEAMHMATTVQVHAWRPIMFGVGVMGAGLSAWAAWEYAHGLEGEVSYLVLAAPLVAVCAAIIPPFAEWLVKRGQVAQAILWAPALIACLATVFYTSAERVHYGKAGQAADIVARREAASRAEAVLADARARLATAEQGEARARAQKECGPQCRTALATAEQARANVTQAEQALARVQAQAIAASDLKAPAWLLPVALDLVTFMAIWAGLGGPWWTVTRTDDKPAKRHAPRRPRQKAANPKPRKLRAVNDGGNVVNMPA